MIIVIGHTLYGNNEHHRRKLPSIFQGTIGWISSNVNRQAERLGNWIETQCRPSTDPQRKIIRAYNARRYNTGTLCALSVLAMQANATIAKEREVRFDTDSANVGVDNRCSACISHEAADFVQGTLKPCNRVVKGFGGSRVTNVQTGTLEWSWEDDSGAITTFRIPDSYYVPAGKVRLLSPQHWAQSQATTREGRARCSERTDGNACTLSWSAGTHQRRIPIAKHNNVATFTLAPGFESFNAFCVETGILDPVLDIIALPSGLISDDEEEDDESTVSGMDDDDEGSESEVIPTNSATNDQVFNDNATTVDFDLNGPTTPASEGESKASQPTSITNIITDEEDRQPSDLAELL